MAGHRGARRARNGGIYSVHSGPPGLRGAAKESWVGEGGRDGAVVQWIAEIPRLLMHYDQNI